MQHPKSEPTLCARGASDPILHDNALPAHENLHRQRSSSSIAPLAGPPGTMIRAGSAGSVVLPQALIPPEALVGGRTLSIGRISTDVDIGSDGFLGSVVKVYTTIKVPDYGNPWQSKGIEQGKGSAVVIQPNALGGERIILTAAHLVADQTFLQVQRTGVENPDKFCASVYAVCHDCDLALLRVESPEFWEGLKPAPLAATPSLRSIVLVAGFPVGGEELSVSEGVVSRIEGQRYAHSKRRLMAITVDASIIPGNSGGPAFNDSGELIGIAFQGFAANVGHIVPPPVIDHFLSGVAKDGPEGYKGFPGEGILWQQLSNPYLREKIGLDHGVTGVLVRHIFHENTCYGILQENDVLTHIDGKPIANNSTLTFGKYGRLDVDTAFTLFQCGEEIPLRIIRDGKPMTVEVTARPVRELVPYTAYDKKPPYFIWCGLVFQPLSLDYMNSGGMGFFGCGRGPGTDYYNYMLNEGRQSDELQEIVVLSQILSDKVNMGYDGAADVPIVSVNEVPIKNLKDLVEKVETATEPLLEFRSTSDCVLIVPSPAHPDAKTANQRILDHYMVAKDRVLDESAD